MDGERKGGIRVWAENRDHAAANAVAAWRLYFGSLYPAASMKVEKIEVLETATEAQVKRAARALEDRHE